MGEETSGERPVSRRGFLGWAFGIGTGIVALVAGIPMIGSLVAAPRTTEDEPFVEVGNVADLASGEPVGLTFVARSTDAYNVELLPHNVWAVKSGDGAVTVFSPVCTHLGCQVFWDRGAQQFVCPCHNSVFSKDGKVLSGPAPRALDTLPTKISGGVLSVQWVDYVPGTSAKTPV